MLASTVTVLAWYAGAKLNLGGIFGIDALWPGLTVSAAIFFPVSLIRPQSEAEKEKLRAFLNLG